ncbi:MAG: M3 family oligoendopeptidase [Chloroflexota bacterium]
MPKTAETYKQTRWSLDDLFLGVDSPELQRTFESLGAKAADFEKHRDALSADISKDAFLEIVRQLEEITRLMYRLHVYAGLLFSEDTQNQEAQTLVARVQQFGAELQNRTLFFELWWKALDDTSAERLMDASGDYRYWLEEMRHFKPYTLTEPEEKIINLKNVTGFEALSTLYSSFTNRYVFKIEVNGEVKELTRGELMVFARHHDPDLRAKAYQELYRVYGEDGSILGQMYQTLVRDWHTENVNLRHFSSPLAVRNLMNDIPDEVVDTLLDVCEKNAHLFQRFFQLKARWLKTDRLRRYDIYAPVVQAEKTYSFGEAAHIVLDSFEGFEPKVSELARRVFTDGHLDSEVRKGKRSGAFCWAAVPELTPWVLLNYQGRPEDVATMAHELGHAIHSMLAADHSVFTFHSSLPLAETASTFGEMILVERLLAEEEDEAVRRDLLFRQVDESYGTIMRQAFFALFERKAHDMVKGGASVDELSEAYIQNLNHQFKDAVEVSDEFKWEWVSIPHIYHTPFYVYAYAFGQLLVLSLYQQYKEEGESFKPRYLKILESGGSEAPIQVLSEAGIEIRPPKFWQGGFNVIGDMISQLEGIPKV